MKPSSVCIGKTFCCLEFSTKVNLVAKIPSSSQLSTSFNYLLLNFNWRNFLSILLMKKKVQSFLKRMNTTSYYQKAFSYRQAIHSSGRGGHLKRQIHLFWLPTHAFSVMEMLIRLAVNPVTRLGKIYQMRIQRVAQ